MRLNAKRVLIEVFAPALLGPVSLLALDLARNPQPHVVSELGFLAFAVPLLVGPGMLASAPYTALMELVFWLGLPPNSKESQALSIGLGAGSAVIVWFLFNGPGWAGDFRHFDFMKSWPAAGVGGAVGLVTSWLAQRVSSAGQNRIAGPAPAQDRRGDGLV